MQKRKQILTLHSIAEIISKGSAAHGEQLARKLMRLEPRNVEAVNLCGAACLSQGKFGQARAFFMRAISMKKSAIYYLNLALAESGLGNNSLAENCYRECLSIQPDNVQAANNLANILSRNRQVAEAEDLYLQVISACPEYVVAYKNLSILLRESRRADDSVRLLNEALVRFPGNTVLQIELATSLENAGRYVEAADLYSKTQQWGGLQRIKRILGDWADLDRVDALLLEQLICKGEEVVTPWSLINLSNVSPLMHREAGRRFAESTLSTELAASPLESLSESDGRLRVGYLSCDFYDHATLMLLIGVLECHDLEKYDVRIFDYGALRDDALTRRLSAIGLPHYSLTELSNEAAAKFIAQQGVHILIDLKGYTTGQRLGITALRPAPVIVSWLGYPGSLGHQRLADYLIGDHVVTPLEHSSHFSETLALMPHSYQPNDCKRSVGVAPARMDVGLPEQALVFCSFNQLMKLTDREFDLWCRLLREIPGSVLWIVDPGLEVARNNILREARGRGVSIERIIFAPRLAQSEHLARLSLADIALDSFPCTSHTTASDALWCGVPYVTRLGETFASRVAGSLLRAHGLGELIAIDQDDCYARIRNLAENHELRHEIRRRLLSARESSPLFDTLRFTRNLEGLFHSIWGHYKSQPADRPLIVSVDNC